MPDLLHRVPEELLLKQLERHLSALPYRAFLILVSDLLPKLGYTNVVFSGRKHKRGRSKSGGRDLEAYSETQVMATQTLVVAKQYRLQRRFIDELRGTMLRLGTPAGLVFTTKPLWKSAIDAARAFRGRPIRVIGGREFALLLIEHRIGVKPRWSSPLNPQSFEIDREFFLRLCEKAAASGSSSKQQQKTREAMLFLGRNAAHGVRRWMPTDFLLCLGALVATLLILILFG